MKHILGRGSFFRFGLVLPSFETQKLSSTHIDQKKVVYNNEKNVLGARSNRCNIPLEPVCGVLKARMVLLSLLLTIFVCGFSICSIRLLNKTV